MRKLRFLALFLCSICLVLSSRAQTATVVFTFSNFVNQAVNVNRVIITPDLPGPTRYPAFLSSYLPPYTRANAPSLTNGLLSVTNLILGYSYNLEFSDGYQTTHDQFYIETNYAGTTVFAVNFRARNGSSNNAAPYLPMYASVVISNITYNLSVNSATNFIGTNGTTVVFAPPTVFIPTNFDVSGAALSATNGMRLSTGIAAFHPTNEFDLAGAAAAAALAATNPLTPTAYKSIGYFQPGDTTLSNLSGVPTNKIAFTNDPHFDVSGAALSATNGMRLSTGIAAFHPTNEFDLAGAAAAAALAATNPLTPTAYKSIGYFQPGDTTLSNLSGVPTNKIAFTNDPHFDVSGAALSATNGMRLSTGIAAFHPTNEFDLAGAAAAAALAATNGNFIANVSGSGINTVLTNADIRLASRVFSTNLLVPAAGSIYMLGNGDTYNSLPFPAGGNWIIPAHDDWKITAPKSGWTGISIGQDCPAPQFEHGTFQSGTSNDVAATANKNVDFSTMIGGLFNTINTNGSFSVAVGGSGNYNDGQYGFVAGQNASNIFTGTWIWSDPESSAIFASTGANQFLVRASGGVGLNTNAPPSGGLGVSGLINLNGQSLPQFNNLTNWATLPTNAIGLATQQSTNNVVFQNGNATNVTSQGTFSLGGNTNYLAQGVAIVGATAAGSPHANGTYQQISVNGWTNLSQQQLLVSGIGISSNGTSCFIKDGATVLYSSPSLSGPWTIVSGTSPAPVSWIGASNQTAGVLQLGQGAFGTNQFAIITNQAASFASAATNGDFSLGAIRTNDTRDLTVSGKWLGPFEVTNHSSVRITGPGILLQNNDYLDGVDYINIAGDGSGINIHSGSGGGEFTLTADGSAKILGGGSSSSFITLLNGNITNVGVIYGNGQGLTNLNWAITNSGRISTNFALLTGQGLTNFVNTNAINLTNFVLATSNALNAAQVGSTNVTPDTATTNQFIAHVSQEGMWTNIIVLRGSSNQINLVYKKQNDLTWTNSGSGYGVFSNTVGGILRFNNIDSAGDILFFKTNSPQGQWSVNFVATNPPVGDWGRISDFGSGGNAEPWVLQNVKASQATNDDIGNNISSTYMTLSNSVSNPSLQIGKLAYDASGFHYMSPIGYDPHFYTGSTWNETNIWTLIDGIKACGIASAVHGQYSVDLTHWQGPPAQMTNVPNQWMLLPDTNKFIHGFQWTLNYAHSNGCILKLYLDSVNPMGNDIWTTNSAGQNIGGWTNVLPNLTNLAGLYPTLDAIHYDANAGEDGPTAYYRAFTVDNVWRSLITNRPTFFEHDTMPGSYMFNHRLLSSFPDGTLFGLLADPTGVALTNGFFNYLLQAVDEQTNLALMFPTSGKFIHPQQVPVEGANQGYGWTAYLNMAGAFGWGMIVSSANGGAANYTASSGPPLASADYGSGLWDTNLDFIYCKEDTYSSAFIANQDTANNWQVWSRELTDGSYAVLMLNRNLTVTNTVSFAFNQIGGLGQYQIPPAGVVVRDVFYGTNFYGTGLNGFTNAIMPNQYGEPAKLFRVYFLGDRPYDQAQGYGNVAPLGNATASTVTITNNTANGANTSGDLFIYKPLGTVPQMHWQKTNVYWNWEMDNHVGDYAITLYSFPDFNTPKFDFRTNGDLLVSGDLIIGQRTGTPHFTLSGFGDFMRVNGNGGTVLSAAKNLSTELVQLGLDNNTAGEQFYAKGTLIGEIKTNGMFISVAAVFTNTIYAPTNTGPVTRIDNPITLGTSLTTYNARTRYTVQFVLNDSAVSGSPALVFTNFTAGTVWTNGNTFVLAAGQTTTWTPPTANPGDVVGFYDKSTGAASVTLVKSEAEKF